MKTFDLNSAIKGAELVTRNGSSARVVCYDRKDTKGGNLIGLVLSSSGNNERIIQYDKTGRQINFCKELDLFLKD